MGKFYCIEQREKYTKGNSATLLQAAAKARGISFVAVYPEEFDHTNIPVLSAGDMVYRVSTTQEARIVERLLLQPEVTSFYFQDGLALRPLTNPTVPHALERVGVPVVPTIYDLPQDKKKLEKYAKHLGGFPIVVKDMGGSHGVGVMKIDSLESLASVSDVLNSKGGRYVMRTYIDYTTHYRLIVLGDKVVGTVEYPRVQQDFRSNVGQDLKVIPTDCSDEIKDLAIRAVHAKSYEFGGVDILIAADGKPYVAEANFPCYFPRVQHAAKIDIADMMVERLADKAKNSNV